MTDRKLAVLVVCPGRGSYNMPELGYLHRFHADKAGLIGMADRIRAAHGQPTISELDGAERYSAATYTRGDVASPLIYTCSLADYLAIDPARHEIVAVTGNSMGWYTSLACAGAVGAEQGFAIVDGMGRHSQQGEPGGQVLLTLVGEDWQPLPGLREAVLALVAEIGKRPDCRLYVSIELGGMIVVAGNEAGLAALLAEAPATSARAPLRLANHGPFHTPMMQGSADRASADFSPDWFASPALPLIDGRGHIWHPFASAAEALWRYTFTNQILETYDFTRAVQVAAREFAPDRIVLLGPGDVLGGAIAQALIGIRYRGLRSKPEFLEMQAADPVLLAMGRQDQRAALVANAATPAS